MKEVEKTFSFCMCVQQLFSALVYFFAMSNGKGPHLNILTDVPSHRQYDRSSKWTCFSEHVPMNKLPQWNQEEDAALPCGLPVMLHVLFW